MPERVAIYARVSTDEQANAGTIETQLRACKEEAKRKDYDIIDKFCDEGVSGSLAFDERPEASRLLDAAKEQRFDKVLVYCVDRLSRDVGDGVDTYKLLKRLGTPAEFVVQSIDGTPEGQLQFHTFLSFAEYERHSIARRTKQGKLRRAREGRHVASTVAYGYTKEDGKLKPHPEQAAVVKQMFEWSRDGLGLRAIARKLEERGIETPTPTNRESKWGWHITTISKLLHAERYTGRGQYTVGEWERIDGRKSKKRVKVTETVEVAYPPLVDQDLFDAVQAALVRHKKDSRRSTKKFYLLQHLTYCRSCGSRFTARTVKGRIVYMCRRRLIYAKKPGVGHEGVAWRLDGKNAETAIKKHLLRTIVQPDYLAHEIKVYREESEQEVAAYRADEERLRTKLADLERQERGVLDGYEKGLYRDEQQALQRLASVRAEMEATMERIAEIEVQVPMELSKAEKLRLVSDELRFDHAWRTGRGLPWRKPTQRNWEDKLLADLARRDYIEVEVSDDAQYMGIEFDTAEEAEAAKAAATTMLSVPVNEWWHNMMGLIDKVWVEHDGKTLMVEGTLQVVNGRISLSTHNR